jgi:hypothetical protein
MPPRKNVLPTRPSFRPLNSCEGGRSEDDTPPTPKTHGCPSLPNPSLLCTPGEHEHVISGYSLLKGIGDGEPIASDRFSVGGHEWVLLFYPDGKRSINDNPAAPPPNDDPYAALFVALIGEVGRGARRELC